MARLFIYKSDQKGLNNLVKKSLFKKCYFHEHSLVTKKHHNTNYRWDQITAVYTDDLFLLRALDASQLANMQIFENGKEINYEPRLKPYTRVVIYNCRREGQYLILDTITHGLNHGSNNVQFVSSSLTAEVINTEHANYYNEYSKFFAQNFVSYKIRIIKDSEFHFLIDGVRATIFWKAWYYGTSFALTKDVGIEVKKKKICFTNVEDEGLIDDTNTLSTNLPIYIFSDRTNRADDSAEALYRYYMQNHPYDGLYLFALASDSKDYKRLEQEGFNMIEFGSYTHQIYYLKASVICTSHTIRKAYSPVGFKYNMVSDAKIIILQHGVISHDHRNLFNVCHPLSDLMVTSSEHEAKYVHSYSGLDNLVTTGLPRFDNYHASITDPNLIVYAPSWSGIANEDFTQTERGAIISSFLNNQRLHLLLTENNLKLQVILHPLIGNFKLQTDCDAIEIVKSEDVLYSKHLAKAQAIITDYSSLLYDGLYQYKPIICYSPYEPRKSPHFYPMLDEVICEHCDQEPAIKSLQYHIQNKFELSASQKAGIDKFFIRKESHCAAVYEQIEKLLK